MCGRYEFEMTMQSIHDYYGVENLEDIPDIVSSPQKDVRKQRYRLARADVSPLAFAGFWEAWNPPFNGGLVETYTIITCEPNVFLGRYHNRQPVILQPAEFDLWLDPEYPHAKGLLAA